MGYSMSVGVSLMDELAHICEQSERRFTEVRTDLGKAETQVNAGQAWS